MRSRKQTAESRRRAPTRRRLLSQSLSRTAKPPWPCHRLMFDLRITKVKRPISGHQLRLKSRKCHGPDRNCKPLRRAGLTPQEARDRKTTGLRPRSAGMRPRRHTSLPERAARSRRADRDVGAWPAIGGRTRPHARPATTVPTPRTPEHRWQRTVGLVLAHSVGYKRLSAADRLELVALPPCQRSSQPRAKAPTAVSIGEGVALIFRGYPPTLPLARQALAV